MKVAQLQFSWQPISSALQNRIHEVLDSWDETPYMCGQLSKGQGVDCVRFICSVYDELYGFSREDYERLPQDVALHDREGAIRSMKEIISRYECAEHLDPKETKSLQPGDALIVGPKNGGPGHCLIVGGKRNRVYHAIPPRVQWTGIKFMYESQKLFGIYRMSDRDRWAE